MIPDYKKRLQRLKPWHRRLIYFSLGALLMAIFLPLTAFTTYTLYYHTKLYPGVSVAGVPLGGLTPQEAEERLAYAIDRYIATVFPLHLTAKEQTFVVDYSDDAVAFNANEAVQHAYNTARSTNLIANAIAQWKLISAGTDISLDVALKDSYWTTLYASMAASLNTPVIEASIELVEQADGKKVLAIEPGRGGELVAWHMLTQQLRVGLESLTPPNTIIPIETVPAPTTDNMIELTTKRGEKLINSSLVLTWTYHGSSHSATIEDSEMVAWLDFNDDYQKEAIDGYLDRLALKVNQAPQNATFQFDETNHRVVEFAPAIEGSTLQVTESRESIITALKHIETGNKPEPLALSIQATPPEISLQNVNNLGITERIGTGQSTYKGSIAGRVHNVALAASRINGTLIKPGDTFSFNNALGEVSGNTGYQKAYIIINGRTELDDGGGVCQVSTTVFRAALNAGLPITERRAHAYRVGYYEQNTKAGLDATVFSPSIDFKFTNDTPNYILIQTVVDTPNRVLTIHFYGTSDGRTSTISNHEIWAITPPPPDIYQDDPTLPLGTIKQVEHKVAGAKAKFDYEVSRNGEVIYEKTFYSSFKPWAAIYLRGTGQ